MTATVPREITAQDAKAVSTEGLLATIDRAHRQKTKLIAQNVKDRQLFNREIAARLVSVNDKFIQVFDRMETVLRAELKKRLH